MNFSPFVIYRLIGGSHFQRRPISSWECGVPYNEIHWPEIGNELKLVVSGFQGFKSCNCSVLESVLIEDTRALT